MRKLLFTLALSLLCSGTSLAQFSGTFYLSVNTSGGAHGSKLGYYTVGSGTVTYPANSFGYSIDSLTWSGTVLYGVGPSGTTDLQIYSIDTSTGVATPLTHACGIGQTIASASVTYHNSTLKLCTSSDFYTVNGDGTVNHIASISGNIPSHPQVAYNNGDSKLYAWDQLQVGSTNFTATVNESSGVFSTYQSVAQPNVPCYSITFDSYNNNGWACLPNGTNLTFYEYAGAFGTRTAHDSFSRTGFSVFGMAAY